MTGIAARYPQGFLRFYVRAKIATDPVYEAVYQHLRASDLPVIDVGCGLGILALYLRERGFAAPIVGIDHDARKIAIAQRAAASDSVSFRVGDARSGLGVRGNVVLLDVLHYFSSDDQSAILRHASEAGGMVLIRDAIRDGSLRYRLTYAEEALARAGGWLKAERLNFPTREAIERSLNGEFIREVVPMYGRSPFNNYLFAFKRASSGMTNA